MFLIVLQRFFLLPDVQVSPAFLIPLILQNGSPRQDNIISFSVIFKDIKHQGLTDKSIQISYGRMSTWEPEEMPESQYQRKVSLHSFQNGSFDGCILLTSHFDIIPNFILLLYPRQNQIAVAIPPVYQNFNLITHCERDISFIILNSLAGIYLPFSSRHRPYGIGVYLYNFTGDNRSQLNILQTLFVEFLKSQSFFLSRCGWAGALSVKDVLFLSLFESCSTLSYHC